MSQAPEGCGACTMCCTLLGVAVQPDELQLTEEGNKPPGVTCQFCDNKQGGRCTRHDERPKQCQDFQCLWLMSQRDPSQALPPDYRPDRLKAMVVPNVDPDTSDNEDWSKGIMTIHVPSYLKHQKPWRSGKLGKAIQAWDKLKMRVYVQCGDYQGAVTRAAAIEVVRMEDRQKAQQSGVESDGCA